MSDTREPPTTATPVDHDRPMPGEEPLNPPRESDDVPSRGKGSISAPAVFWPATILLTLFVVLAAVFPTPLGELLGALNDTVIGDLGWYYILLVSGFVVLSLVIALSPMGNIVLGRNDEEAEFGLMPWFAMLFAAGMGIGLVFWGVAEPLNHFANPPPGTGPDDAERAREAMSTTFLHWGLHAWAIYVVVGLAIAYTVHRRKRPVSIRWALEPLLGNRVNGWIGNTIDVIAILGTLFGVATSLGFGVIQVGAGISFLGWIEEPTTGLLLILIVAITGLATISVATGLDKGIKILSNINIVVAGLVLLTVLLVGPTVFILSEFVQQIGVYLRDFFRLAFRTLAFQGEEGQDFVSTWTTFYWGWWISWAPFVGVFIARISRGRTVRQFVIGVLLVPTSVTFLWFSVLGGTALYREMFGAGGIVGEDGAVDTDNALFQMLDGLGALGPILSVAALFLIVVFFVTSSDSGSFVVDMLASGGNPQPPVWSRVMWAVFEGAVAAVLILVGSGGLDALQTMAILLAFPFSIVMIAMAIALMRSLLYEHRLNQRAERTLLADEIAGLIVRRSEVGATPMTTKQLGRD